MNSEPRDRLVAARRAAGYKSAAAAARALGIEEGTYRHHENGLRGFDDDAPVYARRFHVSLEWLLTGRGDMRDRKHRAIPVAGFVGAGANIELVEAQAAPPPPEIDLPADGRLAALQVAGQTQWPRFLDGEYILYDTEPVNPATQIGRYAVVQTLDGRRLIKIIFHSPGGGENRWQLVSHNAPPEDGVPLMGCWRYLGVLPAR